MHIFGTLANFQAGRIKDDVIRFTLHPILMILTLSPGARFDDGAGGDNEVQRTMLELINQLDGFDPRGNV